MASCWTREAQVLFLCSNAYHPGTWYWYWTGVALAAYDLLVASPLDLVTQKKLSADNVAVKARLGQSAESSFLFRAPQTALKGRAARTRRLFPKLT